MKKFFLMMLGLLPAASYAADNPPAGTIEKEGGNVAIISQNGSGSNTAVIHQSGSNNKADVTQTGEKNELDVTQEGENNEVTRYQSGDSKATIRQNGDEQTYEIEGEVSEIHRSE